MPEGLGLVLPTRVMPFVRTRLFSWPEKLRMAKDLVWPRILPPDDIAVGTFLRRRLGSPLVDRLAGPLVGGVYGTPIDELSLDAVVPQLRAAERDHRCLLFAGLAEGRAMRAAMAGAAAGLEGARRVRLAARRAWTRSPTRSRRRSRRRRRPPDRARGALADPRRGRGRGALRRRLASPGSTPRSWRRRRRWRPGCWRRGAGASRALEAVPHGTWILVTLAYPRERVGRELVGHGYLVPASEGGADRRLHLVVREVAGPRTGRHVLLVRMFVRDEGRGRRSRRPTWSRPPAPTRSGRSGSPASRCSCACSRWDGAMPRYTVGHLDRVAAIEAAMAAWPAVMLAGASYRGRRAARLRRRRGRGCRADGPGRLPTPAGRLPETALVRPESAGAAGHASSSATRSAGQGAHRLEVERRPEDQHRVLEPESRYRRERLADLLDGAAGVEHLLGVDAAGAARPSSAHAASASSRGRPDDDIDVDRPLDLALVAADRRAGRAEHRVRLGDPLGRAVQVPQVGMPGDERDRLLRSRPADAGSAGAACTGRGAQTASWRR